MNHDTLVEIFFTITAAAVIIITIVAAIVAIYVISIVRTIRRIVLSAEFAAEMIKEGVAEVRHNIQTRGFTLGSLLGIFKHLGRRTIKRKK
jgi:hypothetical protein